MAQLIAPVFDFSKARGTTADAVHFGAPRFLFEPLQCVPAPARTGVLRIQRAVSDGKPGLNRTADAAGTDLAVLHHVKTRLNFLVALLLGLLASFALPTNGAVEAIVRAVDWIGVSGIAEFAAAANALAIVP